MAGHIVNYILINILYILDIVLGGCVEGKTGCFYSNMIWYTSRMDMLWDVNNVM